MIKASASELDRIAACPAVEKHYRVPELAKLWGLSANTIYKMFNAGENLLFQLRKARASVKAKTGLRGNAAALKDEEVGR